MTENEGATASSRFPSFFFITTLFLLIPQVMRRINGLFSANLRRIETVISA